MRKAKKVILGALCACALVVGSVAATVAYLTSTDETVNTFTVGNVAIHLDEKDTDGQGSTCEFCVFGRDHSNAYHLIPGVPYEKDPTVTVLKGSEECYVRMLVTVSDIEAFEAAFGASYVENGVFLLQNLVGDWNASVWQVASYAKDGKAGVYEFRYFQAVDASQAAENIMLEPLFKTITVPGDEINNEELAKLKGIQVNVVAQAIQVAGFADADAAWVAFE